MPTSYTKTIAKLIFIILFALSGTNVQAQTDTDSLLNALDKVIRESPKYVEKRVEIINALKEKLKQPQLKLANIYAINEQLINEYDPYICDSAIAYINKNIKIATQLKDIEKEDASKIRMAYLMASTGMYKEAFDMLQKIDRVSLPHHLEINYYKAFVRLYDELQMYSQDPQSAITYNVKMTVYLDSLIRIVSPQSNLYLRLLEDSLRGTGHLDAALKVNKKWLLNLEQGTHEYAVATYYRAFTYQKKGDTEKQKFWLIQSAISDVESAIKDQASLRILAKILYDEGDIERAYNYIRTSWNATSFYNAKLRTLQTANILSIIDKTYQAKIEKQKMTLQHYLIFISSLSILLLIAVIIIYIQIRRLIATKRKLQSANIALNKVNENLHQLNLEMAHINNDLSESNKIKEVYIGRFIELCSIYINKIDDFRRLIHSKIKDGKVVEARRLTQSQDIMDEEYAELYNNFDNAFLQLFPNFVEKVNELLKKEDRFVLKKGEILNPELRIIALMRLGINDGAKISQFLRYSLTTIYNYRTKTKNRTYLNKDEFDKKIQEIS